METCLGDQTRIYLFGYEEPTGYEAFNVISPEVPTLQAIVGFIGKVEDRLALPGRRALVINMKSPVDGKAEKVIGIELEFKKQESDRKDNHPISAKRRDPSASPADEKQNDETARMNAVEIRKTISSIVNQERVGGARWETPAQRLVTRKLNEFIEFFTDFRKL